MSTLALLSTVKWTNISITWKRSSNRKEITMALYVNGERQPKLIADVPTKNKLLKDHDFKYFGIAGSPAFWDISTDSKPGILGHSSAISFTNSRAIRGSWETRYLLHGKELRVRTLSKAAFSN